MLRSQWPKDDHNFRNAFMISFHCYCSVYRCSRARKSGLCTLCIEQPCSQMRWTDTQNTRSEKPETNAQTRSQGKAMHIQLRKHKRGAKTAIHHRKRTWQNAALTVTANGTISANSGEKKQRQKKDFWNKVIEKITQKTFIYTVITSFQMSHLLTFNRQNCELQLA